MTMMMMMIMRMTHWNGAKAATISWISVKQSWNFIRHVFIILQDWAVTPAVSDAGVSLCFSNSQSLRKCRSFVLKSKESTPASYRLLALCWIWVISSIYHLYRIIFYTEFSYNKFLFFKCHWVFRLHRDMHLWYLKLYNLVFPCTMRNSKDLKNI